MRKLPVRELAEKGGRLLEAVEFVIARMDGVTLDSFDYAFHCAIIELLRSDIPLDPKSRDWIASAAIDDQSRRRT